MIFWLCLIGTMNAFGPVRETPSMGKSLVDPYSKYQLLLAGASVPSGLKFHFRPIGLMTAYTRPAGHCWPHSARSGSLLAQTWAQISASH